MYVSVIYPMRWMCANSREFIEGPAKFLYVMTLVVRQVILQSRQVLLVYTHVVSPY